MTHDEVRVRLFDFPGVEDGTSYGEPSFKVAGKFFTRLRPALDDSIVVYLDSIDERELLIEMDPATFHFTDHYRNYPMVPARLASVDPAWLTAMMTRRWRKAASKSLQKKYPTLPGEVGGA